MLTVFMGNMEYLILLGRNVLPLASRWTIFTPSGGKYIKSMLYFTLVNICMIIYSTLGAFKLFRQKEMCKRLI